jgi:hypothetical protein
MQGAHRERAQIPVVLPTPQQYAVAQRQLSRALFIHLGGNPSDFARYQTYARYPAAVTLADACWATRVTLHAIISMRDPERDFILLRTILQDRQDENPSGGETTPAGPPFPAPAPPPGAPEP